MIGIVARTALQSIAVVVVLTAATTADAFGWTGAAAPRDSYGAPSEA
ncbi:MAG TPA: hypothetical protein VKE51_18420 [Vicinamibacterales bacterium]|nr:hypothetical protein [Vicinamibacterales bacterium]